MRSLGWLRFPTPVHELKRAYVVHFWRSMFGDRTGTLREQVSERLHALDACHAASYFNLSEGTVIDVQVEATGEWVKLHRASPKAPWRLADNS